jgi:DNA polymerase elongation subunit (family B)
MTKEEKIKKIESLKKQANELKNEVDYFNALQLALKLVLNGSYGAWATKYFILYNDAVASTITAEGRELTQKMDKVNQEYWYNQWHLDTDLHKKLCIRNVNQITPNEVATVYGDTDSLFVSFKPAIDNCEWKNIMFDNLDKIKKPFVVLARNEFKTDASQLKELFTKVGDMKSFLESNSNVDTLIIDGYFVKDRAFNSLDLSHKKIIWNWTNELDFIHGIDNFRIAGYFKEKLEEHAASYGVENREDFELERIDESIISIAKKKYIQHIVYEDGISYDRLTYLYPKGVELVRSSTPAFARDKIVNIVKYLFSNPDTFNIKELLKLVKDLKKEFDLCIPDRIDEIAMQSSCSNYEEKVLNDKDKLEFVTGAHFGVKAAAYYNHLLYKNKHLQEKYEFIKSGSKIKYYYCKNKDINDIFAYTRGSYPIEMAPDIDLTTQFSKCILSPINSIIEPLGLPKINERLSVILDIFAGF